MDHPLRRVFVANGELHAQQVRAFLEAAGIPTSERGEALRHTHGLTVDGRGAGENMVAESDAGRAPALLAAADSGMLRLGGGAEC